MNVRRDRRQLLATAAAATVAAALPGCPAADVADDPPADPPVRSDVPLRIVWLGDDASADQIRRRWLGVSDQPIEITTVDLAAAWADDRAFLAAAGRCDLVCYPIAWLGTLHRGDLILPVPVELAGTLPPTLPTTLAVRIDDRHWAVPIASNPPVVLRDAEQVTAAPESWSAFDQAIRGAAGRGGQPTGTPHAASGFLHRWAQRPSPQAWLFSPATMRQTLASEAAIGAMEELLATLRQSGRVVADPVAAANQVSLGDWVIAVGDRSAVEAPTGESIQTSPLPGSVAIADPSRPVASLAASCRQTAVATGWLQWTTTIGEVPVVDSVRLTLTLPGGAEYLNVLNDEIVAAVDSDTPAAEVLRRVGDRWDAVTDRIGVDQQAAAWAAIRRIH